MARSQETESRRPPPKRWWIVQGCTLGAAAITMLFVVATRDFPPPAPVTSAAEQIGGLPEAPDYHALVVARDDENRILLGTHDGVYESMDGGKSWLRSTLVGVDAMSLQRARGSTVWAAGHDLLAVSNDGGRRWRQFDPTGLPSLDIHALAVEPDDTRTMYAAVAGKGLYRSADGGRTFTLASDRIGADVVALTLTGAGHLLASDRKRGLLVSFDAAKTWERLLPDRVLALDAQPRDPKSVLAGGPGVLASWDSGRSFRQVLEIAKGAGPVAWAPSERDLGYAVGFDRRLYRTRDGGHTWTTVS